MVIAIDTASRSERDIRHWFEFSQITYDLVNASDFKMKNIIVVVAPYTAKLKNEKFKQLM